MNYQSLKELQESVFKRCLELTDKKGNDYSRGNNDVLRIFRESADELGISKYQAIGLFMKKHINAIFHYMKTGGQSESEPIRERVVDAINYLTFLLAAIEDEDNARAKTTSHRPRTSDDEEISLLNEAIEEMRQRKIKNATENPFSFDTNYKHDGWKFPQNVTYTLKGEAEK